MLFRSPYNLLIINVITGNRRAHTNAINIRVLRIRSISPATEQVLYRNGRRDCCRCCYCCYARTKFRAKFSKPGDVYAAPALRSVVYRVVPREILSVPAAAGRLGPTIAIPPRHSEPDYCY